MYARTFPVIAQAELKTIVKSSGSEYKIKLLMKKTTIYGIFDDEEVLLSSVKEIRSNEWQSRKCILHFLFMD